MHSFTADATMSAVGEARKSADVSRTRHPTEGPLRGSVCESARSVVWTNEEIWDDVCESNMLDWQPSSFIP